MTISVTNCDGFEVQYTTSWTTLPLGQMYLTYDPCNDPHSGKGNYWTDGNFIEVWGLGDGWMIVVDNDFI